MKVCQTIYIGYIQPVVYNCVYRLDASILFPFKYNFELIMCMLTWVMFKYLSATSPMTSLATEHAGPRIISLVGWDGSVCWIRWYVAGTDEHYT